MGTLRRSQTRLPHDQRLLPRTRKTTGHSSKVFDSSNQLCGQRRGDVEVDRHVVEVRPRTFPDQEGTSGHYRFVETRQEGTRRRVDFLSPSSTQHPKTFAALVPGTRASFLFLAYVLRTTLFLFLKDSFLGVFCKLGVFLAHKKKKK